MRMEMVKYDNYKKGLKLKLKVRPVPTDCSADPASQGNLFWPAEPGVKIVKGLQFSLPGGAHSRSF